MGIFTDAQAATSASTIGFNHVLFADDPEWRRRLGEALGCDLTRRAMKGCLPTWRSWFGRAGPFRYSFECRPKMGRWDSFLFAILPEEGPHGAANRIRRI